MSRGKMSEKALEEKLTAFGRQNAVAPKESLIEETVEKCIAVAVVAKEEKQLSYGAFFWVQVKLIQKRWWVLQGILLMVVWLMLDFSDASGSVQRGMSIAAALFVVLIMPEIWKNRETNSMEIEEATFYSLKQVYSAKILAFGFVDICMLTIFCFTATSMQDSSVYDLLKQFVFPLMVATGICFAILCSKRHFNETVAVFACMVANGLWAVVIMNGALYAKITPALWNILFVVSGLFVFVSIRKTLCDCDKYWEVVREWN